MNDKKLNRTTTFDSLRAVVGLLLCDTREQFEYYYRMATKDRGGKVIWWYITQREEYDRERVKRTYREKSLRNKP